MKRTYLVLAAALTAAAALTGCSGDSPTSPGTVGDSDTWPGTYTADRDSIVGTWKGPPTQVQIDCSSEGNQIVATFTAPGGWTAVATQPEGGGDAGVTVTDEGGTSVEIAPHGDAAVAWGAAPTLSTWFDLEDADTGWQFYLDGASCAPTS